MERPSVTLTLPESANSRQVTPTAAINLLVHYARQQHYSVVDTILKQLLPHAAEAEQGYKQLLSLCLKQGEYTRVERYANMAATDLGPRATFTHALAISLRYQNRHDEAIDFLDKNLAVMQNNASLHNMKGVLQMDKGESLSALRSFTRGLDYDPELAEIYWNLTNIAPDTIAAYIKALVERVQSPVTNDRDRAHYAYSLFRWHESQHQHEEAWHALQIGANAKRKTLHYSADDSVKEHSRLSEIFSNEQAWSVNSNSAEIQPIFICGMPRSGTSLLEQMLSCHKDIIAGGERVDFVNATRDILAKMNIATDYPPIVASLEPLTLLAIAERYLYSTKALQARKHFTDKMPLNYKAIPLIRKVFPKAKVILCRRQPVALCFANYRQLFVEAAPYSYDLTELSTYFLAYDHLVDTFLAKNGHEIFVLPYEQLVTDTENTFRELCAYLDIDFDSRCLNPHLSTALCRTASVSQIRKPIDSKIKADWKPYASKLGDLLASLQESAIQYERLYGRYYN